MKILVAYGTLTMNTETVADHIYNFIQEGGEHEAELRNVIDIYDSEELTQYDLIIIGTSSWSEGSYPPDCEEFMDMLARTPIDLENKPCAFFGLGEIIYEDTYNIAIKRLRDYFLENLNVTQIGELHEIDGYPDDSVLSRVEEWINKVLISNIQ